jgi:hypothetical protein
MSPDIKMFSFMRNCFSSPSYIFPQFIQTIRESVSANLDACDVSCRGDPPEGPSPDGPELATSSSVRLPARVDTGPPGKFRRDIRLKTT